MSRIAEPAGRRIPCQPTSILFSAQRGSVFLPPSSRCFFQSSCQTPGCKEMKSCAGHTNNCRNERCPGSYPPSSPDDKFQRRHVSRDVNWPRSRTARTTSTSSSSVPCGPPTSAPMWGLPGRTLPPTTPVPPPVPVVRTIPCSECPTVLHLRNGPN